jgi:hypothetical protein
MRKRPPPSPDGIDEPINLPIDLLFSLIYSRTDGDESKSIETRFKEFLQAERTSRLLHLLKMIGVSEDDPAAGFKLAMYLAIRFHPGFQLKKSSRPVGKPQDRRIFDIGLAVTRRVSEAGVSERIACRQLSRTPEFERYRKNPESMYRAYKRLVARYRGAGETFQLFRDILESRLSDD